MSGINQGILLSAQRMRCVFVDDIGNSKVITGSGFWLNLSEEKSVFITNKHNVDASLKLGEETRFKLASIEIELRKISDADEVSFLRETQFVSAKYNVVVHASSDVALISCEFPTEIVDRGFSYPKLIKVNDIADRTFLENSVSALDTASFIGFAGTQTSCWWDTEWNLAVARTVSIASMPKIPFKNNAIKTSNVLLVSGLSFSGSSGSLVISHEKGIKTGAGLSGGIYTSPKIIGIMSGHWWEGNTPDMFNHSGLSYLTMSTSIIDVLKSDFLEYL